MEKNHSSVWLKPFSILLGISLIIFFVNMFIDSLLIRENIHPFASLFSDDIGNIIGSIGNWNEVVVAVLGIEITVLAIIVQLAANKYSSKIMELFVQDRTNFLVISLFVITAVNTMLVSNTVNEKSLSLFSVCFTMLLIIVSLLIVLPHFNYVFNFLRPTNFLNYVKESTIKEINKLASQKRTYSPQSKEIITNNINFIGDIALNSVYQGDRAVILLCIGYLREIAIHYINKKSSLPAEWFKFSGNEFMDPDFASYSSYVIKKIESNKILLERKIFGLYEVIFNNARQTLRDVASGVLLNTELITEAAGKSSDAGSLECCLQYFNSYMRAAIRGKDPRSAFNTLEHYRVVAESLLDVHPEEVEKISFYFKYYGQEASKNQVLFIIETAAHDLCKINEIAYEKQVPNLKKLLEAFLTLDEPIEESKDETGSKELSLIGVRIAQVKLAGYYLLREEKDLAKMIFNDMKVEPPARIKKIKEIIFNTKNEEFWEITPRGINFYYVSPARRNALIEFFNWFEDGNGNS